MFRLLLAFTLAGERGQRPNDGWFGADKVKHFFSAAFVQSVAYSATRAAGVSHGTSLAVATGVTAGASVGKE